MKIRFKKLDPNAIIPEYKTPGASGFDFCALEFVSIWPGDWKLIRTGLAMELVPHHRLLPGRLVELQIRARSGLAAKTGYVIKNGVGTIDYDYRGEIMIIILNAGTEPIKINPGDRIAQGVVVPVFRCDIEEAEELGDTERGSGGFGHTGVALSQAENEKLAEMGLITAAGERPIETTKACSGLRVGGLE